MGICKICGKKSILISETIGVCVDCLRSHYSKAYNIIRKAHEFSRNRYELPQRTPSFENGIKCNICGRGCVLAPSTRGYCGSKIRINNSIIPITTRHEISIGLHYYDPHPTNCVAYSVCPAVTGRGYPRYALTPNGERGFLNIAVFHGSCNMDCLYCQNWEYRKMTRDKKPLLTINDLLEAVNLKTTCVCFFGGDPGPWSTHALYSAKKMLEKVRKIGLKVFRVCWETNGLWNPNLFEKAVELSLETGGIVKIDFKAWSYEVYSALTGIDKREHLELIKKNITLAAEYFNHRPEPPLIVISTLLVPGYIDEYEIDHMTKYVAELNRDIPYIFLGFHPDYLLTDLPRTSINHAKKAVEIAKRNGLRNVYVENQWLLSSAY
ncbi:MAG: radical SAM protein [Staphylothermus sp.]|nr:radical SAM protein [Staphylothermus sp.]